MAITRETEDKWMSENYGLPSGLYYYYLGDDLPDLTGTGDNMWNEEETGAVLGNCSSIQSIQLVPFLRVEDMDITQVEYDSERYGGVDSNYPKLDYQPFVFRINALLNQTKDIGSFKCYQVDSVNTCVASPRSWKNESKLYNYPYSFAMITDHMNPPLQINYSYCYGNTANVKVIQTISDRCSYGIYVENYKGDNDGSFEAMVSGDAHELPASTSSYAQWKATSQNQIAQSLKNQELSMFMQNKSMRDSGNLQALSSGIGLIGSILTGNILGGVGGALGLAGSLTNMNNQIAINKMDYNNAVKQAMATEKDMLNAPNTMISMGSDVYYGLAKGHKKVELVRFGLTSSYYEKLGNYFALFGYKQNRIMNINTKSRYYYNYVKTVGVNLSGNEIPRSHFEELKEIYNNGVTIWHTFRDGVKVGDYQYDNVEV